MTAMPSLDAAGNAAVMVMLLEADQATNILAELEPDELRLLGEKMCALGEIGPDIIASAIKGCVEKTEKLGLGAHDRVGQVHSMMTRAVGEVKANNLMHRINPAPPQIGIDRPTRAHVSYNRNCASRRRSWTAR